MLEQLHAFEQLECSVRAARQEYLVHFVEQARGRHAIEHPGELRNRRGGVGMNREAELRGEAHGAQHAHRVLAIARLRIADHAQHALTRVVDAADVIPDREVLDVVVQSVGGEIAPPDIFVDRAVEVVAQDAAALVEHAVAAFVDAVVLVDRRVRGTERRDLDDLVAEAHMGEMEAAADQPAIAEQLLDLVGMRAGGDVEVLGMQAEQQVAHRAADEESLEAGVPQPVQHLQRVGRDVRARDRVLVARDHPRSRPPDGSNAD